MNPTSLTKAIESRKLLALLLYLSRGSKTSLKALSTLLNRLDHNVQQLSTEPAKSEGAERHTRAIETLHAELLSLFKHSLDGHAVVKGFLASTTTYSVRSFAKDTPEAQEATRRHTFLSSKLDAMVAATAFVHAEATPRQLSTATPFPSAARNSSWLPVLLLLGVPVEDATRLCPKLQQRFGSSQGRASLAEKLNVLSPSTKSGTPARRGAKHKPPAGVVEEAMYEVAVKLNQVQLQAHPYVSQLLCDTPQGAEPQDPALTLTSLFAEALTPMLVEAGKTNAEVATVRFAQFTDGLARRKKVMETEAKTAKKKAEAAQQDAALLELKKLDKGLLNLLKKNPELLKQL